MIGVIDVGGGLRGSYGAGVFDYCMDKGISFDCCVGVSAGAANICSYCSGQRGRNYRFYTDYTFRPEYMSFRNMLKTGNYIGLDYIYGTLSNSGREDPLDYGAMLRSGRELFIVATDALSGEPVYFTMKDLSRDHYDIIKASSCVPIANRAYEIDGRTYFDGGLSDPIPFHLAQECGCDRFVVILTKPRDFYRDDANDVRLSRLFFPSHRNVAERLRRRGDLYNFQLDQVKELEKEGRALILAPRDTAGMKTLTRDREAIIRLYEYGFEDAEALGAFMRLRQ